MRLRHAATLAIAAGTLVAACGSDGDDTATTDAATTPTAAATDGSSASAEDLLVVAGEPFPEARCAANREAGTITYLTGFNFAATASIIDVIVAEDNGYYDDLCLDVEVLAGGSTENYPLIASGNARFASGGSFSEVVEFGEANDADFVAVAVEGRTAIDSLIVKPGQTDNGLTDLEGTTIGVKFKLPPSIEAMLLQEGLVKDTDYTTVLLDGFDPIAHMAIDEIVGLPGYKSNEPGALDRAGIAYDLYDPLDYDIPGSFGVIYTTRDFLDQHPTAAEDFVRATMRGLADAIADPEAAAQAAIARINESGNPMFLSPEGEAYRWQTDAALITDTTPAGTALGVPDLALLQNELDTYAKIGVFGDGDGPEAAARLRNDVIGAVYDATGTVIWPA